MAEKRVFVPFQQDFHQYFRFFPLKIQVLKFWQYWKLEKSDITQNMERKLNLFTLSRRKVLDLEIYLKILEIWTTLPPEIQQIKFLRQSWTLISRLFRNVAEKCFSANVPKVLIFGLLIRTGTINDFSC